MLNARLLSDPESYLLPNAFLGEVGTFLVLQLFHLRLSFFCLFWRYALMFGANYQFVSNHIFGYVQGINLFPLCTANVKPIKSGEIIDRRDHVLMTDFT